MKSTYLRRVLKHTLLFFVSLYCVNSPAQLVMPGDYPDPSVTKIGDAYWATATTSNWGPVFPLLRSDDLIHWETKAFVLDRLPEWADYYFWAPEISYENGTVYVYYSAHRKNGNLCLGVASADTPDGPYKDHGPLMCQDAGSIDAFPIRDENGKLFLIWKEDGNSVGKPTPIWISEMREDRTAIIGEKRELFRNDAAWEGNLVEGVSVMRHGDYFYAFYAAAACCGPDCNYATGIARAQKLLGPWEKYSGNPVLASTDDWKCPGHGTPVVKDGKFFFLYHAYHKTGGVYAGRQGLLKEFHFTPDGWIRFSDDVTATVTPAVELKEEFEGKTLSNSWQWSVFNPPRYEQSEGTLSLYASGIPAFLAHKTFASEYHVRTTLLINQSASEGGLAAIGDDRNLVGISFAKGKLQVSKVVDGNESVIMLKKLNARDRIVLEMQVSKGSLIHFRYSLDGKTFKNAGPAPVDGGYLPPWDRAVRVGVTAKGQNDQKAVFENFILYH
jgi:xylan 1,4-beta-xylosidase